jgi:hypothetical protein
MRDYEIKSLGKKAFPPADPGEPGVRHKNIEGLQEIEWVILGDHSGGSMMERTLRRRYSSSFNP